ncbi:ROK family protein [Lunatibacter salilacus]|uniref:ROK family protein n=1 Tax=Lunatibacter salilacus TaxID=2483804 RepID=UPI00131D8F53|nr:ROK family protein [Lunatibacter salilacus]
MDNSLIGVDIGGSHLTAGFVNPIDFTLNPETIIRKQVDSLGSKEEILSSWEKTFQQMEIQPHTRVGIAMPAPFDYTHGIAQLKEQGKFRSIYGINLRDYFSDRLQLPGGAIFFYNDAASFLQGEAMFQRLPSNQRLIGITLGTGLGSAFKMGDWAEDAALWSSNFKGQQAEYYLGTGWFVNWIRQEYEIEISGLKELMTNPEWEDLTRQALEIFGTNLGEFLAIHCTLQNIEKIIIGGNMAKAKGYFVPAMRKVLNDKGLDIEVVFSQLGEHAALVGAASSCLRIGQV